MHAQAFNTKTLATAWLALASSLTTGGALLGGTGQLDLNFDPRADELGIVYHMTVADREAFIYSAVTPTVSRIGDNGRLDPEWKIHAPVKLGVTQFSLVPWGGFLIQGFGSLHEESADGTVRVLPTPGFRGSDNSVEVNLQDDGSLVSRTLEKVDALSNEVPNFAARCHLRFGPPNGFPYITQVLPDRQGRLLVIGNFVASGAVARLGIVRVLQDGRPDPNWNPAAELGIELDAEGALTARPISLAIDMDDSVLVEVASITNEGLGRIRFARLNASGSVVRWFDGDRRFQPIPPIIQPDGRILLGGYFGQWQGRPATGLVRLNPDGSLDETFQVDLESPEPGIIGMTLDQLGRLWFFGSFESVNGVARPGLARIFAYNPSPKMPAAAVTASQRRIGTNETLHLTTSVSGFPPPTLQWFRNGEPIPGATNRGLRLPVELGTPLGEFRLVASNSAGPYELPVSQVELARRSPRPGQIDPGFDISLERIPDARLLVPLPEGRLLLGAGFIPFEGRIRPMLGCLREDGTWDPEFGQDGIVAGDGLVEAIVPLPDGGVLVAGHFQVLAGEPASGLAELDRHGRRVTRGFPTLDVPQITTILRQPNGDFLIAGAFTRVNGVPAYHLARLAPDWSLDSHFQPSLGLGQLVDALGVDSQGRVLIAGSRASFDADYPNFQSVGLRRLLPDGKPDAAFRPQSDWVEGLWVEAGDRILVGIPPRRLAEDGQLLTDFNRTGLSISGSSLPFYDHRTIRLQNGGVICPAIRSSNNQQELIRWEPNGEQDSHFQTILGTRFSGATAQAIALLPNGTVIFLAWVNPANSEFAFRLRRLLPDPDSAWAHPRIEGESFRADLATQTGRGYHIGRQRSLQSDGAEGATRLTGDGYIEAVVEPLANHSGFLELKPE